MNALDGLKNKMATNGYMTNIEMAIYNTTEKFPITALHAAEELAQKDAALDAAFREMLKLGNDLNWPREIPMSYAEAMNEVKAALKDAE